MTRCSYRNCNRFCAQVEYIDCSKRLLRTGKVCNGCADEKSCHKRKLFYIASRAQEDYRRVLSEHRQGAALEEWERKYADHPGVGPVYMDLVIGRPGGVCLMTLHWLNAGFMVGILIPNKCAENVTAVSDRLYAELGADEFSRLFPVILTDRGTEFPKPSRIELTEDGVRRTWVFFRDCVNSNTTISVRDKIHHGNEYLRHPQHKGNNAQIIAAT